MSKFSPNLCQKIAVLADVRYEIEGLLTTPKHDSRNEAIVETVYFRKMAHARSLHTFFTTPTAKRYRNDVISEDFSFASAPIFPTPKSKELLARFNQALFHISYSRMERTPADKAWPIQEFTPPIIDRSRDFIRHVLSLRWPDIPKEEITLWARMLTRPYVKMPLAQCTSNVATPQIISLESHIKDT